MMMMMVVVVVVDDDARGRSTEEPCDDRQSKGI